MATKVTTQKKGIAAPVKKAPLKSTPAKKSPKQSSDEHDTELEDFFIDEIKDIYWAEKHLTKVLPKMQKATSTQELKDAIGEHLEVTKTHVSRLEEVFELLGQKAVAKKCDAMEGITKEGDSIIEDTDAGTATRDVGIILACQKVEHYEIATYGGLTQLAKTLGKDDIAEILAATLAEEKEADSTLTEIAENSINYLAAQEA
ncbi:MAG: ferritin-like domain-containing protein [Sphingobacteriales bacterium]|nr:ferritin-like domain-containing protein [Sphingobacteriales bacterium]